jgi:hypothetical protein
VSLAEYLGFYSWVVAIGSFQTSFELATLLFTVDHVFFFVLTTEPGLHALEVEEGGFEATDLATQLALD